MQMRTSGRDVDFLIELTLCFIEIGIVHSDSFSNRSFSSISVPEMLVERHVWMGWVTLFCHTQVWHQALVTSLSYSSAPSHHHVPKSHYCTGSQRRRMWGWLIPAFGISTLLQNANKAIWHKSISCHFKIYRMRVACLFGFLFYLKPLTVTWIRICV